MQCLGCMVSGWDKQASKQAGSMGGMFNDL